MSKNKNKYVLTSPLGVVYTTINLSQFCRDMGISLSGASKCARGVCTSFWKGWTCKYSNDRGGIPSSPLNTNPKERIGIYKHKDTLWYSSEDILKCLGYQRTDFRTIRERKGSIMPYIDSLKVRYWNSTSILRLKETLKACDEGDWQRMLKVLELSKKESVFLATEDEVLSNPFITKLQDQLLEEQTKNLELKIEVKVQEALNSSLQKKLDTLYKVVYTKDQGGTCKEKYTILSNLTVDLNTILKINKKVSIVNISPC